MTLDELNALTVDEARALVADWYDGIPETPFEQDRWDNTIAHRGSIDDAKTVTRMYRFMQVRGAPGKIASAPLVWQAMGLHPDWRAWLGINAPKALA